MVGKWKAQSLAVIASVIAEHPNATPRQLRQAVRRAYPFGSRSNYPYQAWKEAVEAILGPSERKQKIMDARAAEIAAEMDKYQGRLELT